MIPGKKAKGPLPALWKMMPALWKIRREWQRLGQKLRFVPELVTEPLRQRAHDRTRQTLPEHLGGVPCGGPIALFLIHQPGGLAASTLGTCDLLAAQGYAPFVVSNGPLTTEDQARLLPHVWRLLVRPNYGYDFGGYRDGILRLFDLGLQPERLVILNDSFWFVQGRHSRVIERLALQGGDLAGVVLRRRPATSARAGHGRGEILFLESYLYSLPASTFAHPAFAAYWRGYRLSDNKYKVIRRGERDFSMQMASAGMRLTALLTEQALFAALTDERDLRKTLTYAAHTDAALHAERLALLAEPTGAAEWPARALAHLRRGLQRGVLNSAYVWPVMTRLGSDCLKKSGELINQLWRERYLAAVAAGDLPPPDPATAPLAELAARPLTAPARALTPPKGANP